MTEQEARQRLQEMLLTFHAEMSAAKPGDVRGIMKRNMTDLLLLRWELDAKRPYGILHQRTMTWQGQGWATIVDAEEHLNEHRDRYMLGSVVQRRTDV